MVTSFIRILAVVILVFSPGMTTHARAKCAAWSAVMSDYEEGRELSAGNCGSANKNPAYIEIRCGGTNMLMFRLEPGSMGKKPVAEPAQTTTFIFKTNTGAHMLVLRYEGLDGMYAGYYPPGHALFQTLKSGNHLTIRDKSRQHPKARVSLSNSRRAIDAVTEYCRKK